MTDYSVLFLLRINAILFIYQCQIITIDVSVLLIRLISLVAEDARILRGSKRESGPSVLNAYSPGIVYPAPQRVIVGPGPSFAPTFLNSQAANGSSVFNVCDLEARSAFLTLRHRDIPSVSVDDFLHDYESESGTLC